MESLLGLFAGLGLAAACGFRVFVPLLVMGIAARTGHLELSSGFAWIAGYPAMITFGAATLAEIAGYYVPWIDNLLDTIASPAAVVAGVMVTSACIVEMDPYLKWTLAIIAGGGAAAVVQGLTATSRAASTATTGGLGNPLLSTVEAGSAAGLALLAVFLAPLAALIVLGLVYWVVKRLFFGRRAAPSESPGG